MTSHLHSRAYIHEPRHMQVHTHAHTVLMNVSGFFMETGLAQTLSVCLIKLMEEHRECDLSVEIELVQKYLQLRAVIVGN